jgi:hypothetical protein
LVVIALGAEGLAGVAMSIMGVCSLFALCTVVLAL